jgi:hypothetical protein
MFGHCLLRICHLIVDIPIRHPNKSIFIYKVNWKSAYRQAQPLQLEDSDPIHNPGSFHSHCIHCFATDFRKKVLPKWLERYFQIHHWSFEWHSSLPRLGPEIVPLAPAQACPPTIRLPSSIPFAPGLTLVVESPPDDQGKVDYSLDDFIFKSFLT